MGSFLKLILWRARKYLQFYWESKNIYRAHNEFIYTFFKEVIQDRRSFYIYGDLIPIEEAYRNDRRFIDVTDFGAGSLSPGMQTSRKQVRKIYQNSSSGRKKGQLLSKIVRHFNRKSILEIGSNLGVSSGYLSGTNRKSSFIGLEGCPELGAKAQSVLKKLKLNNAEIRIGNFEETLPQTLKDRNFDLVFVDGNHSGEATIRYFKWISEANNNSIIVFDDIYWNSDMNRAWKEIIADSRIDWSIDLYDLGLIGLNTHEIIEPKNHKLISFWKKPYQF